MTSISHNTLFFLTLINEGCAEHLSPSSYPTNINTKFNTATILPHFVISNCLKLSAEPIFTLSMALVRALRIAPDDFTARNDFLFRLLSGSANMLLATAF